ncbi:Fc receptor-like A [Xenopus laevis]|uniref:Fc receptor-like A n=1 Tax=Xenopus laevis TaxID=8355 RepID=A0A8J1MIB4_XENLA|nr:Fc receptor-like A [Xenopus laevis]
MSKGELNYFPSFPAVVYYSGYNATPILEECLCKLNYNTQQRILHKRKRIFFIPLSVLASEPGFHLTPNYQIYMFGDEINLRCCHHSSDFIWQLRFYREETEIRSIQNSSDICSEHSFVIQKLQDRGPYHCAIWPSDNGINAEPRRSQPITMNITESPQAPVISLNPSYPVYLVGEEITVTCLSPGNKEVSGFHFYKEGKEIHPTGKQTDRYIITSGQETAGSYKCGYREILKEREIQSELSSPIDIKVSVADYTVI